MIFNYLKIFFRQLKRQKLISAINLFGLTLGILSSLFIFEYVFYQRSFDGYHEKGSRIYRVVYDRYQYDKLQWKTANSFYPTGNWLEQNYSEVEDWAVVIRKYNITVGCESKAGDKVFYNETKTYYASSSLFRMFSIKLLEGDPNGLEQPNAVVISQNAAERYFGKVNPIGKVLNVNGTEKFTVTGVYKNIPGNSHLLTDFFFSLPTFVNTRQNLNTNWRGDLYHTYLQLARGVDAKKFCDRALPDMIAKNYQSALNASQTRDEYYLQALPDIHLHSNIEYETEPPGNPRTTNILFGFAVFLLLVAWINYVNLVTAQSLVRAREIGIKKINGARKTGLVVQFMAEAFFFNLVCLVITLFLYFLINPLFRDVTNIHDYSLLSHAGFIRTGLFIFLSGIVLSSIYPAFVLSSYQPVEVLKGMFRNSLQGQLFRKGLVTTQFFISLVLLIGTLVTYSQASFLMNKEMGVDFSGSLVIRAPRTADDAVTRMAKLNLFRDKVLEIPDIKDFTFTSDIPGQEINNFFSGRRKGFDVNDGKAYFAITADDRFLGYYKIKLLAGRAFHKGETFDQRTVLMNKLAAERFGYATPEEAVDKIIVNGPDREWRVIGVVDDFYFKSIKTEPVPTVITLDDRPKTFLTMKLSTFQPGSMSSLVSKLKASFSEVFPDQPFEYFSLDEKMLLDLKPDKTFGSVFALFSVLAILIAVIGLILISISQNMRELGVRKILGAEIGDVTGLLSRQMLAQFLIAFCSAIPVSWYGYENWFLNTYNHHITLNFWFFLIPVLIMGVIIFSVIFLLSVNVFRMNLSEVLKYE